MITKQSLPLVHNLLSEMRHDEAIVILAELVRTYPDFDLYKRKLDECKRLVNKGAHAPIRGILGVEVVAKTELSMGAARQESATQATTAASRKSELRKHLAERRLANCKDVGALIELAQLDLSDCLFEEALQKAKAAIQADRTHRDAYRVAEQAAIELGKFDEANLYFLSQPPVVNPVLPLKRGVNPAIAKQLAIPPVVGAGNDYRHVLERASIFMANKHSYTKTVTVIVPVYNRYRILANTLAALTHQSYPKTLTKIIVVDDGSDDNVLDVIRKYESKLDLYYARQRDEGFRVAAARNLGIKLAKSDAIIFMDADILPLPGDVESYMRVLHVTDQAVLIGHRRYVDVSSLTDDAILADIRAASGLPSINPNNDVSGGKNSEGISIDWRFAVYEKTNYLMNDLWPFTKAAGGNIAFSRKLLKASGYMDEDFTAWGCEDIEHGYRLYNAGAYFIPMMDVVSLHQEPLIESYSAPSLPEGESFRAAGHKITKEIFSRKCPVPVIRKYVKGAVFDIPKVSIYIPAYNSARYIVDAVQSCLDQSFGDLEVCICDDGSTDNTLELIVQNFSGNPKVRWVSQENGGIGKATNAAVKLCRGLYIGQLDADDVLKPDAVRACVSILDNTDVDAVYTDCDYIDGNGKYIRDGWCGGEYSRNWMASGMIATHFRMFRKRVWARTCGCNEKIKNAVDLDLWLKIFERGHISHIHEVHYSYRWHGENTSIMHRKLQEKNHVNAVSSSLKRLGLDRFWTAKSTENPVNPREFKIASTIGSPAVRPEDVVFLIPTCARYCEKAAAVRNTWARQLKGLGFRYYFIMGNPNLRFSEVAGDVLYVPCKDDYESLLLKLVLGYEFLHRNLRFTHIFKIDDDCFPNLSKLTEKILPQLADRQYAGGATHPKGAKMNNRWHFGKCSDPRFDSPYRFDVAPFEFAKGGYGYFLRKDVLPFLFGYIDTLKNELDMGVYSYEDVRIAEILNNAGVHPYRLGGYNVATYSENTHNSICLIYDISELKIFSNLDQLFKG